MQKSRTASRKGAGVTGKRDAGSGVLDAVVAAAGRADSLEAVMGEILEATLRGMAFDAGTIYILDPDGETNRPACASGLPAEVAAQILEDVVRSGHNALLTGDHIVFSDEVDRPASAHPPLPGFHAMAAVPLCSEERRLGTLIVISRSRRRIEEADRRTLVAIGREAGSLIARRRAEEALRVSEASYRGLFDAVAEAIYVQDRGGHFIDVNLGAMNMYGYEREHFRGLTPVDVAAPGRNDMQALQRRLDRAFEGEPQHFEFWGRRADGSVFPKEMHLTRGTYFGQDVVIAVAIDITERKRAEQEIVAGAQRLRRALEETVAAMGTVVEMRDPYTAGHERRVTELAVAMALKLTLDEKLVKALRLASDVHDIGKIAVPAEILSKPGRLSPTEFEIIKTHPQVGYDILKSIEFEWPIALTVLAHHERLDGSGYPLGLSGSDIGIESRVLAVADVVEAMASHRPYRQALGIEAALEEVRRSRGVLYDADCVDACVAVIKEDAFAFSA
jgi:PAS domain S-box-containing protein